jgi:RHS repeat-associated protein
MYDPLPEFLKNAYPPLASTSLGSNAYSYDANGNMTSRQIASGTYTLSYDAEGKLVGISGGGMSAVYTYNGDDERVKVVITSGSDTQITAYVGDYFEVSVGDPHQLPTPTQPNCSTNYCVFFPLVMTSSLSIPAGHAWTSYFYVNGQRVAMRVKSNQDGVEDGVFYFLTDHLGSTASTLDSSGNLVGELRYSAWGETRYTDGTTPTQRRYTGQLEAETGLYFYNARWFDPAIGRFAQADTIIPGSGNPQAWDRYSYGYNNPSRYSDPTGHIACDDISGSQRCEQYSLSPSVSIVRHFPNNPWIDPNYSAWRLLVNGSPCTACHVTHVDGVIPDNDHLDIELVQYYRSLDPLAKFVHQAGMQSILNMFALAPIDELSLASSSPKVDRKFPLQSSSEYLQRQGNFARYDTSTGQIIYRVDISGRADAGVPTPHLHYPKYNILPTTGEMILNDWYSPVPYFDAIQVLNPTTQSLLLLFGVIGQ